MRSGYQVEVRGHLVEVRGQVTWSRSEVTRWRSAVRLPGLPLAAHQVDDHVGVLQGLFDGVFVPGVPLLNTTGGTVESQHPEALCTQLRCTLKGPPTVIISCFRTLQTFGLV